MQANSKKNVVVLGASGVADLPGGDQLENEVNFRFAATAEQLRQALPGSEILLGWNFRADELSAAWESATDLAWIHWCGAGVDAVLFPELRQSRVVLTNARGVFDRPIAEYVLGLVLALAKGFPRTFAAQTVRTWAYRLNETIDGRPVLVVGTGSIGRTIARLLRVVGMHVSGVGRTARQQDADFDCIYAVKDLDDVLGGFDFVINVAPLTDDTRGLFSRRQFAAMRTTARFINVGRGASVDEAALLEALRTGEISGAALDVFDAEPLPDDSPLWTANNLVISPHMSGDYVGHHRTLLEQFTANLRRYLRGETLLNIVDKTAGFVNLPAGEASSPRRG